MKEDSLFSKIKKFFQNIFHNDRKLLASKNESAVANTDTNNKIEKNVNSSVASSTTEMTEKDRIFELYNQVKQGKVNLMDIPKSDLDKLVSVSNEEVKILERTYAEKLEQLKHA